MEKATRRIYFSRHFLIDRESALDYKKWGMTHKGYTYKKTLEFTYARRGKKIYVNIDLPLEIATKEDIEMSDTFYGVEDTEFNMNVFDNICEHLWETYCFNPQ